jgi:GTPase SAR1 family protein
MAFSKVEFVSNQRYHDARIALLLDLLRHSCCVNMSSLTPSKVKLVLLGDTAVGKTCIV